MRLSPKPACGISLEAGIIGAGCVRILFLGDMVGKSGREKVFAELPGMIERWKIELAVVNGENAAGGFGITEAIFRATLDAGADVVTTGNHVWDQREALIFADREPRFLRPLNFPAGAPGRGAAMIETRGGRRVLVANIMGRVFMHPDLDDPFRAAEALLAPVRLGRDADAILIDFHAEATSEKLCFAHFLDGRVSAVIGTHTHTPTADARVMPGGAAYVSDAGMCGDYHSSIGMEFEEPLNRFLAKIPKGKFEPATGPATLSGVGIETDDATGLATRIAPLRMGPWLEEARPW
jgi:metallophosphoesterase (TIGR00282 family)